MTSYLISDVIYIIDEKYIKLEYDSSINYINNTLRKYSHNIKSEIEDNKNAWEINKKYSNPYEFINIQFDLNTQPICSYKPLSRSFFKMIEILNHYNFYFPNYINSFHLAEGPGGFIEALSYFRKNEYDTYYGMTLINNSNDVPKWKKNEIYLSIHKNIVLEYGKDKTGNLYSKENLLYIYDKYKHSMNFITGDGGFDYSVNFNYQEEDSLNLIFSQIIYAICLQKKNGSFVLKLFDTFTTLSVQFIFLLNYLYDEIYIIKPVTSRPANSEKYIICKNFRMVTNLDNIIQNILLNYDKIINNKLTNILDIDIPIYFFDKIKDINSIIGQSQIEHIQSILNHILDKNKKINHENIKHSHIIKCIRWCKKNNLPYKHYENYKI